MVRTEAELPRHMESGSFHGVHNQRIEDRAPLNMKTQVCDMIEGRDLAYVFQNNREQHY